MPRHISLTPKKDAAGKWQLNIPADVSPNGKRQRKTFETKRAADMEAERLKGMAKHWGSESTRIPASLADDAAKAAAILQPYGITLSASAAAWVEARKKQSASVTFAELWSQHVELREGYSSAYFKELERMGEIVMPTIGSKLVSDLEPVAIERLLAQKFKTPAYFNLARRTIRPAFSLALRRGYCAANPFDRIDKRKTAIKEIEVVSVAEMKATLNACTDHRSNQDLHESYRVDCTACKVPFAIMAFAGVRPAEMERLEWQDVNVEEGTIRIRGKHAKTRSARVIDVEDNLTAWLETVQESDRAGSITGSNWARRYKTVRKVAKIHDRNDVLRHSFASYHLAAFADVNRTRAAMGHETRDMLFDHYRAVVRKPDAIKFWSVRPDSTEAKMEAVG